MNAYTHQLIYSICSTSVESIRQIDPFYAKRTQSFDYAQDRFAGFDRKYEILNYGYKKNAKRTQ